MIIPHDALVPSGMKKGNDKTITVIEDDTGIRNFISRVLELEGYRVLLASDGSTGLELSSQNPVDLILLDLFLPGIDGWAILRKIKRHKKLSRVPVIVITVITEPMQRKKALRLGAAEYLTKPLSARLLMETVNGILE